MPPAWLPMLRHFDSGFGDGRSQRTRRSGHRNIQRRIWAVRPGAGCRLRCHGSSTLSFDSARGAANGRFGPEIETVVSPTGTGNAGRAIGVVVSGSLNLVSTSGAANGFAGVVSAESSCATGTERMDGPQELLLDPGHSAWILHAEQPTVLRVPKVDRVEQSEPAPMDERPARSSRDVQSGFHSRRSQWLRRRGQCHVAGCQHWGGCNGDAAYQAH